MDFEWTEEGGDGACRDGLAVSKSSEGGWCHFAMPTAEDGLSEWVLQNTGTNNKSIMVGVLQAQGVLATDQKIYDRGWMMKLSEGSLFGGHSSGRLNAAPNRCKAGEVRRGQRITVRLDTTAGTLRFDVDGVAHGPGFDNVCGPVKLCVTMGYSGNGAVLEPLSHAVPVAEDAPTEVGIDAGEVERTSTGSVPATMDAAVAALPGAPPAYHVPAPPPPPPPETAAAGGASVSARDNSSTVTCSSKRSSSSSSGGGGSSSGSGSDDDG